MKIKGTNKDDTLVGTADNDHFLPLRGNDTVDGGFGYDRLEVDYSALAGGSKASTIHVAWNGTQFGGAMSGTLHGDANSTVEFKNVEQVYFTGTQGDDVLEVTSEVSLSKSHLVLDGGAGFDRFTYTNTARYDDTRLFAFEDGTISFNEGTLAGFEQFDLTLGGGKDTAYTGAANDILRGGGGRDDLNGGAGDDLLIGGGGADLLTGGAGADVFQFNNVASFADKAGRTDRITDFEAAVDAIDLSAIDPDTMLAGDQSFTFIGQEAFNSGSPDYQLRFTDNGNGTFTVEGDTNHDAVADFTIELTGAIAPGEYNFIL